MRVVASVEISRPASQVWVCVTQMRASMPGPAQAGVTTHETLRLLGLSFRPDATIDRVEPNLPCARERGEGEPTDAV